IVNSYSYSDNSDNKVYVIEQKSRLVEGLSVVDNLFVLRKGFKKYFINENVLYVQARKFLQENEIQVDIQKRVVNLTPL
ncbi:sugar ABC transporter ATP-binding protein, partial [Klebsiella oxytoca]